MDSIDVQVPESAAGFVTNNRGANGEFQPRERPAVKSPNVVPG